MIDSPPVLGGYCAVAEDHSLHGPYHDEEYGFPVADDNRLFERLLLEINQAGLSWLTILKKREGLRCAYDNFDVGIVANYGDTDRARLMGDAGIIRNCMKIEATIHNAGVFLNLREIHGSVAEWLASHHPKSKEDWVRLFKKTFRFTGGKITEEFLMGIGYLPGSHDPECPAYDRILRLTPPWTQVTSGGS
jgi:DNA-3-methyladenine glycosylase I